MTVEETSLDAYYDKEEHFATLREKVLYIVTNATHPSAADVSRLTDLKINTVTGRLNELEKANLIHKAGRKIDPFTGCTVNYYAPGGKT